MGANGVATGSLVAPSRRAAAQTAVTTIAVEGNRRVEADTIRSYFHGRDGGPLDAPGIDAGLKALYASGLFKDVRLAREGDRLIVTVVEAPLIDRVQFEGNKSLKDKQLSEELQSKPRGTLIAATVQADVARLTEIYKRSGRFDVRVTPKTIVRGDDRVDLVFEIAEGEKTTIRRIDFAGNRAYAAHRLKDVIKSRTTGLLSFLTGNDLYDADRIEADRDLLRRFYLKHGYADVRIVAARAELDAVAKGIVVTFAIEEGEPYRFGGVEVRSQIAGLDGRAFAGGLNVRAGEVYDADAIEKTADDLTIALAKAGHPFAGARTRSDRDPQAHTVDLVFVLDQGPRNYVERINIRGNTRTRDYVIRREFDLTEGDAFNRALLARAERRLKALDAFKSVKIATEPGSAPDRVIVNVDVKDQQTGDLNFGVGYSMADGVIGNVSVSERNLLGRGQYVKLSLTYGQYSKAFGVGFVEPYFLGSRMSLGVDVFGKDTSPSSYQSYGTTNYGTGFRLGLPLTEDTSVALRYSIYNQSVTLDPNATTGTVSLPIREAALAGPAWVSMIGTTLVYDTLDNRRSPTAGLRA